jgi:hypothetical protein
MGDLLSQQYVNASGGRKEYRRKNYPENESNHYNLGPTPADRFNCVVNHRTLEAEYLARLEREKAKRRGLPYDMNDPQAIYEAKAAREKRARKIAEGKMVDEDQDAGDGQSQESDNVAEPIGQFTYPDDSSVSSASASSGMSRGSGKGTTRRALQRLDYMRNYQARRGEDAKRYREMQPTLHDTYNKLLALVNRIHQNHHPLPVDEINQKLLSAEHVAQAVAILSDVLASIK